MGLKGKHYAWISLLLLVQLGLGSIILFVSNGFVIKLLFVIMSTVLIYSTHIIGGFRD